MGLGGLGPTQRAEPGEQHANVGNGDRLPVDLAGPTGRPQVR
ncbi:hypothetical protein Gobs01_00110 [Geodermatophilus obscurus DSM 43160]